MGESAQPDWLPVVVAIGTLLGTFVIAVATVFLWRVTKTLAVETRRMAEISSRPQVVATIISNKWGVGFADLHVQNTGNATAYDITVVFDPPLVLDKVDDDSPPPLHRISVLKPGQVLSSYLVRFMEIIDQRYTVTASWRRDPNSPAREQLTYSLNISDIKGSSQLGASDPLVQIADQIKKLQEDFHRVSTGWAKPKINIITSEDRKREREELDRLYGRSQEGDSDAELVRSGWLMRLLRSMRSRWPGRVEP
jgi:hypothetical protein